ncbi:hypothetical protein N836_25485 [Leptolyngbya sp. Heron Island J]|nr:hypothetical protein N836_25485 [Leptolyngbya sp. Heron Island J]
MWDNRQSAPPAAWTFGNAPMALARFWHDHVELVYERQLAISSLDPKLAVNKLLGWAPPLIFVFYTT